MREESLRIAFVTGSVSRLAGGLYSSVRCLAQALTRIGHTVEVFAPDDEYGAEDAAAWLPIVPQRFRPIRPHALGYAPGLSRSLAGASFDVVHQHGIWQATSVAVSAWRRKTGKPVMISPRGMLDPWALENSGWKKSVANSIYERANILNAASLHALAESEAKAIRTYHPNGRIDLIPNGIDLPVDKVAHRPTFLSEYRCKTLLFIGRIHPKKGIAELIDAFSRLKGSRPDLADRWRLVIAGWDDGGHKDAVARSVNERGLAESIVFPGPIYGAVKDAVLRHADAFILPSYSEGLPMSVLEAWAYRLPVLMTDACNLPEGFAAGAAYRIRLGPNDFSSDLEKALSAHDLPTRGLAGRALVSDRFNWTEIAYRHEQVYRELCWEFSDCRAQRR